MIEEKLVYLEKLINSEYSDNWCAAMENKNCPEYLIRKIWEKVKNTVDQSNVNCKVIEHENCPQEFIEWAVTNSVFEEVRYIARSKIQKKIEKQEKLKNEEDKKVWESIRKEEEQLRKYGRTDESHHI